MSLAGNSTYLMESFNKLVHDLEEPLGVSVLLLRLLPATCLIHPRLASATSCHHSHASCRLLLCCT